jgi:hypothetical protein
MRKLNSRKVEKLLHASSSRDFRFPPSLTEALRQLYATSGGLSIDSRKLPDAIWLLFISFSTIDASLLFLPIPMSGLRDLSV